MAITRRDLAGILAATAALPALAAPQESEETISAENALRANARELDEIPLPMDTEPAFQFKA